MMTPGFDDSFKQAYERPDNGSFPIFPLLDSPLLLTATFSIVLKQMQGVVYDHIVIPLLEAPESSNKQINVSRASKDAKPYIWTWLSQLMESLAEPNYQEEEIAEPPLAMNSPPMPPLRVKELATWYCKSFLQSIWPSPRVIERCIAVAPDNPIRAFGWHPYLSKFAVAPQDGSVRIYDLNNGAWSPVALQHEFQRKIFALAWKPMSCNTLAVGTLNGIFLWKIANKLATASSSSSASARPSAVRQAALKLNGSGLPAFPSMTAAWSQLGLDDVGDHIVDTSIVSTSKLIDVGAHCEIFHHFGHAPVNSISWSPGGRFLAACSIQNAHVLIWDTLTETVTPISQFIPGNITKVIWSPNDEFVCAISSLNTFRVFQTKNWASERWSNLVHPLHSACWSGDGTHLAFTVKGDCKLYIVRYTSEDLEVRGTLVAVLDMSPYIPDAQRRQKDRENATLGGTLSHVAWDPSSSRLVVAIEESEMIAVFQCNSLSYVVAFQPLGYLRGPPNTCVTGLHFKPNFPRGALLTATFTNGKISFFPMYFQPILL